MMPQLLTVRVTRPQRRSVRIWVPVLPTVLLLGPLLILAALAAAVACLMYGVRVGPAFGNSWRLFCALQGTRIDIREGPTTVLVSIR
jgi:hypothetical protein